jgi:hypothetical protein
MNNVKFIIKKVFLALLISSLYSCGSYSTWSTLGYSANNAVVGNMTKIGSYQPPLLKFGEDVYAWIIPGRVIYLENENTSCLGGYEGFTINLWSFSDNSLVDVSQSFFETDGGEIIHLKYLKDYANNSYANGNFIFLVKSPHVKDNDILELAAGDKKFTPTGNIMSRASRIAVGLSEVIPCSNKLLMLNLFINGENHQVKFTPVIYTKFNH